MKIGLLQVQRLGDLIIALPIAQWYVAQGHEVYWPVNEGYAPMVAGADPTIRFMPLLPRTSNDADYFHNTPLKMMRDAGCNRIFALYTHIPELLDEPLNYTLKFDEYKYAVAEVPFAQKWNLRITRDLGREKVLHSRLNITRPYILVHDEGSYGKQDLKLPCEWPDEYQIVTIGPQTDNIFDWIYTIEHAAKRVMIDSCFANLTEQLNITGENYLVQRSTVALTPVYRNGWHVCYPSQPIGRRDLSVPQNLVILESTA